jgi:hypothetical protein
VLRSLNTQNFVHIIDVFFSEKLESDAGIYVLGAFVMPFSWTINVLQVTVPPFHKAQTFQKADKASNTGGLMKGSLLTSYTFDTNWYLFFSSFFMRLISSRGQPSV